MQLKDWSKSFIIINTTLFQYIHVLVTAGSYTGFNTYMKINRPAGSYSGMINGTDYSVSTDGTTGNPKITYLNSTSNNLTYFFRYIRSARIISSYLSSCKRYKHN